MKNYVNEYILFYRNDSIYIFSWLAKCNNPCQFISLFVFHILYFLILLTHMKYFLIINICGNYVLFSLLFASFDHVCPTSRIIISIIFYHFQKILYMCKEIIGKCVIIVLYIFYSQTLFF